MLHTQLAPIHLRPLRNRKQPPRPAKNLFPPSTIVATPPHTQVSVDSLAGRRIHIPQGALPEARHLQPPPNPFHDPRADLLTYVQSAVPAQEVGHMSIGAQAAQSE